MTINFGEFDKKNEIGKVYFAKFLRLEYNLILKWYSGAKLHKPHAVKNAKQLSKFGTH